MMEAKFTPHGADLFGASADKSHGSTLGDAFLIPPFSVLNAREGWWQERKRAWLALGIQSELGRGGGRKIDDERNDTEVEAFSRSERMAAPGGNHMPATNYSASHAKGDGRGRAIE